MAYPTREEIRGICTEQSYEQGRYYYRKGRIRELDVADDRVTAIVRGTYDYEVNITFEGEKFHTACSCSYDFAGDCKHVVAVLLAVDDRYNAEANTPQPAETSDHPPQRGPPIRDVLRETPAQELRAFLTDVLESDSELREQFLVFTGHETGNSRSDYEAELKVQFDEACTDDGIIPEDRTLDFDRYFSLAATHRSHGNVAEALDIYRALATAIRERFPQIEDSTGHYRSELTYALEKYAETIRSEEFTHGEKQPHIEYLVEEFRAAEYTFVRDAYEDALRTICTSDADCQYWLDLLEPALPAFVRAAARGEATTDSETGTVSTSLRTRNLLSSYLYLLDALGREEKVLNVYEAIYLENRRFCREYAERLLTLGEEETALTVVEEGLEAFQSAPGLRWIAASLYRERDEEQYRTTLKTLFLEHREWEAYDELKASCDGGQWAQWYEAVTTALEAKGSRRLLDVYLREGNVGVALETICESDTLAWYREYAGSVGSHDPTTYFDSYSEAFLDALTENSGGTSMRNPATHLEQLQSLGSAEQFQTFLEEVRAVAPEGAPWLSGGSDEEGS